MSTKAQLEELLAASIADLESVMEELKELKQSKKAALQAAKEEMAQVARDSERDRQEQFEAATAGGKILEEKAKTIWLNEKKKDKKLLGVAAATASDAVVAVIEELFSGL